MHNQYAKVKMAQNYHLFKHQLEKSKKKAHLKRKDHHRGHQIFKVFLPIYTRIKL